MQVDANICEIGLRESRFLTQNTGLDLKLVASTEVFLVLCMARLKLTSCERSLYTSRLINETSLIH